MKSFLILFAGAALAIAASAPVPSPAERAIAAARAAIEKNPNKVDGHNALAMALARRARETADGSFYDQAEQAVARSLEIEKDNFEALRARTWILLGKHEFAKALDLAKTLNRRMPDDVLVYGMLADAHTELGNYKEAEEAAQWMLNLGRSGVAGITRAAYLREIFGDIDGAIEFMRMAFERTQPSEVEDRAWVLTHIGHLLQISGRLPEAESAIKESLSLFPDYHYAIAALARVREAQGRHAEAAELFRKRADMAPHPENFFDLAAALHKAGRMAEARKIFADFERRALVESNNVDNANRELARYYADYAGKPAFALKLTTAEIARRKDVFTRATHAWVLYRNGRRTEAENTIDEVLAVGVRDPEILRYAKTIAGTASARLSVAQKSR
jgi:tetratricopeptide (TPR) repeat protein